MSITTTTSIATSPEVAALVAWAASVV
jgi:hypothetical protein